MEIKQTKEGWWVAEGDSHLSKWIEESGRLDHASWLAEMACKNVPEGGVIIDGGAMLGDHTLTYSNKVGPSGLVIAIEPGNAFVCLEQNIKLFPHRNVKAMKCALSNVGGMAKYHSQENLGASTCFYDANGEINLILIDELVEGFKRMDLIKLDIEGWELWALLGATESIKKYKPTLLVEMNSGALKTQNSRYSQITDLLEDWGYTWSICQPQCVYTDPQWDLLAIPIA